MPTGLRIDQTFREGAALVVPHGLLDLGTYTQLRDALIKSVVELPRAVIVDLDWLRVPISATLAVFSSVWMQVADWPGVPIVLVAARELDRRRLARSSIARFMRVYPTVEEAIGSLPEPPPRRRTTLELPHDPASVPAARRFVEVTCVRWGCTEVLPEAVLVASELVENAVRHAHGDPRLRLELGSELLTIAVYDDAPTPPRMINSSEPAEGHLGLVLINKLARAWNSAPTRSGGKVVWAVLPLP